MKNKTFLIIISVILVIQLIWIYYLMDHISQVEIVKKEETNILEESDFIQDNIKEIENSVLNILDLNTKKQSSAVILTSDGLVLTLNSNIPKGNDFDFRFLGESKVYEVRKRDYNNDLALIQIGQLGLKPCSFANENIDLGDLVYILGAYKDGSYVFQKGNVKHISDGLIETDILGDSLFNGAPVFNKKGAILGIGKINQNNLVDIILINRIKDFIDL